MGREGKRVQEGPWARPGLGSGPGSGWVRASSTLPGWGCGEQLQGPLGAPWGWKVEWCWWEGCDMGLGGHAEVCSLPPNIWEGWREVRGRVGVESGP